MKLRELEMNEIGSNPHVRLERSHAIAQIIVHDLSENTLATEVLNAISKILDGIENMPELKAVLLIDENSYFSKDEENSRPHANEAYQSLASRTASLQIPILFLDSKNLLSTDFARQIKKLNQTEISSEYMALAYACYAERNTLKFTSLNNCIEPQSINKVAVIGAGTMGGGIAMCFASADTPVVLIDANQEGLDRGIENISNNYQSRVKRGRMSAEQMQTARTLIDGHLSIEAVHDSDLIIEAVFEDMELKKNIFRQLDQYAKAGTILATNTSTFDINEIAAVTSRPQDVVGLHFFSPANVMPLLEVVYTNSTSEQTIVTSMAIARRIRKTPVLAKICYGFIGNRMMEGYAREAELMALEGATPATIDDALKSFGMAMGMLAVFDMAGIDVGVNAHKANADRFPPDPTYYQASQALYDAGRLGQKNGRGYYQYLPGDRRPYEDKEALNIIKQRAESLNIAQRNDHTEEEIIERCLFALLNEALDILDEGVAQKASDIDVVWTLGYGFPRHKGGPLYYADNILGLKNLYHGILKYQEKFGSMHWRPARLLEKLAKEGSSISQWEHTTKSDRP